MSRDEIVDQLEATLQRDLQKLLLKQDNKITVNDVSRILARHLEPTVKFEVHEPTEEERAARLFRVTMTIQPPLISIVIPMCPHSNTEPGPAVPRVYGSWASEVCRNCGAWRTMTHQTRRLDGTWNAPQHVSVWHPAGELLAALDANEER